MLLTQMHMLTNCSDVLKALQDLCCCCGPVWDFSVWHVGFQSLKTVMIYGMFWMDVLRVECDVNATSFGVNAKLKKIAKTMAKWMASGRPDPSYFCLSGKHLFLN